MSVNSMDFYFDFRIAKSGVATAKTTVAEQNKCNR